MNLGGFGAAGGGADALEQLLQRAFAEQIARKRAAQEDARIKIDQQRANSDDEVRRIAMDDRRAAADDLSKLRAQTGAAKLSGQLRIGQELNPSAIASLAEGDLGDTVKAATLGSRNIGQNLTSTPNPGKGPSYLGTAGQQEDQSQDDELTRQMTLQPALRGRLSMIGTLPRANRAGALTEVMREEAKPPTKSAALQEFEDVQKTPGLAAYQTQDANRKRLAPQTVVIQTVDADGNAVRKIVPKTAGTEFAAAPTASMRDKVEGRKLVGESINAIETLGKDIIANVGPAQRMDAIKRGAEAVFGNDPKFRTYQDARMALAGNLAVAQQGSRPSDADIKAIWLPLVPDPYRDTSESASMKWDLIKKMSHAPSTTPQPSGGEPSALDILNSRRKQGPG
jgi:hypothetical protein